MSVPTSTIQYSGPSIDADVPWEIRRHLQLIYQKLGNHAQAFQEQQAQITAAKAAAITTGASTTSAGTSSAALDAVLAAAVVANTAVHQSPYLTLPASPLPGQTAVVTDAMVNTWGSAVTVGGGTHKVLAWWTGTAWDVIGA